MLVVCAGMLRSGSAFQYNLVSSLLEKMGSCIRHGRIDAGQEWLSHPVLATTTWAQDSQTYHVIKSGVVHPQDLQMIRDGLAQICYVHRDIRDVAVAAKYKWGLTGDSLLEMLDRAVQSYETLEKAGAFGMPWLLHQRYEEVFKDTRGAVRDIARFLKVTPSQEIVEDVVKQCSLEAMETISRSKILGLTHVLRHTLGYGAQTVKRFLPPPLNGSWGLHKLMLRALPKNEPRTLIAYAHIEPTRGVPGAWRDQLAQEEQEVITARYKGYLIRAGYSV